MPRLRNLFLGLLLALVVAAVSLAILEIGSFIVLRRVVSFHTWKTHPAEKMAVYRGAEGQTFWQEQRRVLEFGYHPFLQRRTKPFSGSTINVDGQGLRRTINPRCKPGAPVMWMFGGSTVWGFGNTDAQTIPSQLAAELAERGQPACVVNYGEDAWTATQSVVKLVLELKQTSRPPDVVIFLSGCNDLFTPYRLTGDPDLEFDYVQYGDALDQLLTADRGSWGWLELTNSWTLWEAVRRGRNTAARHDPAILGPKIVRTYFQNLRAVEALATGYGFRSISYWQPMPIFGAKPLSAEENEALGGLKGDAYRQGIEIGSKVIPAIRAHQSPSFRYLGDLFDDRKETLYIDGCHLHPEGSRLIAQAIADEVQRVQNGRR